MITSDIRKFLSENRDTGYRDFHSALCPSLSKESIIGIRIPILRKYAGELSRRHDIDDFLSDLPHKYYEENNLHAFIIETYREFDKCISALDVFLPYIDNWATCDCLRPKCFSKNSEKLLPKALEWVFDDRTYVKRFGIGVLMNHYLDASFDTRYLDIVSCIKSEEYYVRMMVAWYFATALAKQYDSAVKVIEKRVLDAWTHNKTIQKAVESYRIPDDTKLYLKSLKI